MTAKQRRTTTTATSATAAARLKGKGKAAAGAEAKLLYAASERSADLLYLGGVFVPDPFAALQVGKRAVAAVNALEFARVRRASRFDEVYALETLRQGARERLQSAAAGITPADIIAELARCEGVSRFIVPEDFPTAIAFALQAQGYSVRVAEGELFPRRAQKNAAELKAVAEGNKAAAAGIAAAASALRQSTIKNGWLYFEGKRLTSERLRTLIDIACLETGAVASHTICAGGDQACDPHEGGHGPLRANQLIIVDVFPRVSKTGYHGDMTRTFLKGRASEAQRKLVHTVREAQSRAIAKVKAGTPYASVHAAVTSCFDEQGYRTFNENGQWHGFFHSTGHGLGLEVHEAPRLSKVPGRLKVGEVVTVEPGLYYPGLGGCRIEDVVAATADGHQPLSKAPYVWELK